MTAIRSHILLRRIQDMGGKQDGFAAVRPAAHHLLERKRGLGVKPRHRFIENPDGRIVQQRAYDYDFLTHAVGIALNLCLERVEYIHLSGKLFNPLRAQVRRHLVHIRDKVQVFYPHSGAKYIGVVRTLPDLPAWRKCRPFPRRTR